MKCMTLRNMSYRSWRTWDTPGHHQEQLQYLEMAVVPMVATQMVVIAKKMVPMIAMVMTQEHMVPAVQR